MRNPADIIFDSERFQVEAMPDGYNLTIDGKIVELTGARATAFIDDFIDNPEPEQVIERHFNCELATPQTFLPTANR